MGSTSPTGSVSSIEPTAFLTVSGASSPQAGEAAEITRSRTARRGANRNAGRGDRIVDLSFRIRPPVYALERAPAGYPGGASAQPRRRRHGIAAPHVHL